MLAFLILVASVSALAQFFLAYCRSLLRMYAKVEVSEQGRRLAGLEGAGLTDDAFPRIVQLLGSHARPSDDRAEVFSIRVYYFLLRILCAFGCAWPAVRYWVTAEKEDCAHFAAVALDRRNVSAASEIT